MWAKIKVFKSFESSIPSYRKLKFDVDSEFCLWYKFVIWRQSYTRNLKEQMLYTIFDGVLVQLR